VDVVTLSIKIEQDSLVVQIRTGCGQFKSDMYFLRLSDGRLITSENQSYKLIPE
jgi:hypothetical protein